MTGTNINANIIDIAANHPCFGEHITNNLHHTANIIRQLQQPLLAFGDPVCCLCGESPANNNLLRAELLDRHAHNIDDPNMLINVGELTAALEHANLVIADRNQTIQQLRKDSAA